MRPGRTLTQIQAEVQYVIGSGRQAFSYLIEHDGFLFESPITWYAKDKRWGLSPGYAREDVPLRSADPLGMSFLPLEPGRTSHRHDQQVSDTGLRRGPRDRLRALPRARRAARPASHVVDGRDVHDRQSRESGALAPRRRLRAMPPDRPPAHRPARHRAAKTFGPVCRSIVSGRCSCPRRRSATKQVRQPGRANARQPLLPGQCGPARLHFLPRSARPARAREKRRPISGIAAWIAMPIRVAASRRSARALRSGGDDCIGCHMPRSSSSNNTHVATTNHRIPRHDR